MSTKGVWYPDRSKATEKDPPLYLHISATTPDILQKAIDKVNELIAMDLGSLVDDKKDRLREKVRPAHFQLVITDSLEVAAQMARSKDPRRAGDDPQLQRPCKGGRPSGHVRQVHPVRDRHARSDQGSRFRIRRPGHRAGARRADVHPRYVRLHSPSHSLTRSQRPTEAQTKAKSNAQKPSQKISSKSSSRNTTR